MLEPDRVALLWVIQRFVDPAAHFYFVEPFSQIEFGVPIDIPEAEMRRGSTRSATEILLEEQGLLTDPRLRIVSEMTHLFEITPWLLPTNPAAHDLGLRLTEAVGECEPRDVSRCVTRGLSFLEEWYARGSDLSTVAPGR